MSSKNKSISFSGKSIVQSVIFGKNWNSIDARRWLKRNNFTTIGRVQKPKKGESKKYIIKKEEEFKKPLGFKRAGHGISLIIGTLT